MDRDGFARIAAVVPEVRVADVAFNEKALSEAIRRAADAGAEVIVTPELGLTGYSCGDLFLQQPLLDQAEEALGRLIAASAGWHALVAVGLPVRHHGLLYNCAAVLCRGTLHGLVPKTWLPEYGEYYEKRWFAPGMPGISEISFAGETYIPLGTRQLFQSGQLVVGVEICEDLWTPIPPSSYAAQAGANLILNLSASNEVAGKHAYLLDLLRQQSARLRCAYAYASAGFGESSSDVVYSGNGIVAENGRILASTERFSLDSRMALADVDIQLLDHDRARAGHRPVQAQDTFINQTFALGGRPIAPHALLRPIARRPFVPAPGSDRCEEISSIQVCGLARRLRQLGGCTSVIGVSGGLDSTLALLVAVGAYDLLSLGRERIHAVTMPGFATTGRTHSNARILCEKLGVSFAEIPIGQAAADHLRALGHDGVTTDVTYENAQARERTQVLMDYSNKLGGIVIGTGDLSELALGWCTYNGDHMSMYGVNASVPKTLVRHLIRHYADKLPELSAVLQDILDTPVSPELVPAKEGDRIAQLTEDLVGPYELHDFFLYNMVRNGYSPRKIRRLALQAFHGIYTPDIIDKWLRVFYRRFFAQQFKRNCLPDGPKVGSVCLSPRGDWRMPADASAYLWLNDLENEQ